MKRILNLLKYESWPNWLGPTLATVGIGGFFIGRNVLTRASVLAELATIYEEISPDTILYMNDEFQMRFVSLQKEANDLKKTINELEITSQFAKRLLDLNAEVSYIGGAEFISNQASERSFSIEKYISRLLENVRQKEYELARAKSSHIERSNKSNMNQNPETITEQPVDKTEEKHNESETNFDIMNSRED